MTSSLSQQITRSSTARMETGLDLARDSARAELRRELLEFMSNVMNQEHVYRSSRGRFAGSMESLGLELPRDLSEKFQIQFVAAGEEKLLISASARDGVELLSIDQDDRVDANFKTDIRPEQSKSRHMDRAVSGTESYDRRFSESAPRQSDLIIEKISDSASENDAPNSFTLSD